MAANVPTKPVVLAAMSASLQPDKSVRERTVIPERLRRS
jgi:hypothetical protein